ncbi:MAG: hypothetical protein IPJ68_06335 [Candidatus Moraniibacteriota bacterium]|nr:MAG: hypothetical protein IPJ68_06335 [Candidatus Moranbacteria bacterium]
MRSSARPPDSVSDRGRTLLAYERVPKYWNAWGDWELRKTFINDKPGVSLALITGQPSAPLTRATHCVEQDNRLYQCQVDETAPLSSPSGYRSSS